MQYVLTSVIYLPLRKLWLNLSKPLSGFFGHQPVTLDLVFGTVSCSAGFVNESMVYYHSHLTSVLCWTTINQKFSQNRGLCIPGICISFMSYYSFLSTNPYNLLYQIRKASYQIIHMLKSYSNQVYQHWFWHIVVRLVWSSCRVKKGTIYSRENELLYEWLSLDVLQKQTVILLNSEVTV